MTVISPYCATPSCCFPSGAGRFGRFCEDCAQELARIAEDVKSEGHNMHKHGMDPSARRTKRRAKRGVPTCCNVGCQNERLPPDAYCPECMAAGTESE